MHEGLLSARTASVLLGEVVGVTPWVWPWSECAIEGCPAEVAGWRVAQDGHDAGIQYACRAGHRWMDYGQPPDEVREG